MEVTERVAGQSYWLKVENPYVGPRPFEEREQKRFFGRDWEADELVALIVAHPAVLLYAQSGAGKTSLINAKLIPLLRDEEGLEVMPVARVRGEIPQKIQPEQIENLFVFNTLLGWIESGTDPAQLVGLSLSAFLQGQPRPRDEEGQPTLRVVIFDQFEELFTLYPERWTEREGFFAQVAEALSEDPFLRVLFVLREDYLAQLDPYVALLPERLRTRFRLERLRREAALAAVKGPLRDTERSFAPGVAESLVEELLKIRVETRVGETVEVPGQFVEPVQLQVVCRSLWEELPPEVTEITQSHLQVFGDVDQALLMFYERALSNAVQQTRVRERKLRAWFERDLITPMGTRGTVYRGAKSTGGIPNATIDALESRHLIRAERRAGARWYELTHDRFIGPIQRSNEAWRTARRDRWLRISGGIAVAVVLLFVGIMALQAIKSKREVAQAQAAVTVAVQEAGTAAAQVEETATAALDSEAQATAAFRAWQTAQAQATAASLNLLTVQAQATATSTRLVGATPQPGGTETPEWDPTATAAVETATAAAQSLQIAAQKVVVAAAELEATATAAASATATARELREQLQTAGLTGRGVKVAILSTGIDATHPDLAGRIAETKDFVGEGMEDGSGSGTFTASIVAGSGAASGGLYKGLAPEADLYIAKVLGPGGAGTVNDVIAGIKWAVEQEVDIVLVDMGGASGCDGSDELSREADAAVEAGLVVVVPAGNSGPEPGTVGSPGCARLPITVGAAELNTVANYSSRGPTLDGRTKPDLLFSGYGVGAQAANTKIGPKVAPGYVEVTGSSVSAAHAAGAIALLFQADPNLTPAQVKDLLMETATDLGFDPNDQGAGLADIEEALAHVRDQDEDGIPDAEDACPDEPGLPEHDGCPDSDGDGIPDAEDACPDEPGPPRTGGCPEPTPTPTPSATPTATLTPTPSPTWTPTVSIPIIETVEITGGVKVQMVYVPAGKFIMGSDEEDEQPVHAIYLDAFYIDRTEVTNEQFEQFVQDTGHETGTGNIWKKDSGKFEPDPKVNWRHPQGPDDDLSDKADHPVVQVGWEDAEAYCRWRGARLPTEAEWEKAAGWDHERGRKLKWPWGNDLPTEKKLNYCDVNCMLDWKDRSINDGFRATAPVGSYPEGASPYGVLDMSGNVWEWVTDYYDERYYEVSPAENPLGPDADTGRRVLRSGSWFQGYEEGRAASRFYAKPDTRNFDIGFRCAQSWKPAAQFDQQHLP